MASNQTSNYGLNQWEATDQVLREDFNADNSKIDAALKGLADKDAELEGTLAGQAAAIAKLGNCSIERFTYVGTGDSNTTIHFSRAPLLFIVMGGYRFVIGSCLSTTATSFSFSSLSNSTYMGDITISWNGMTLFLENISTKNQTYQVFGLSTGET